MCEIITIDPEVIGEETTLKLCKGLLKQQKDGLGVMAIFDTGDSFEYEVKKSINPHWFSFFKFMRRARERGAWRFVIHARASTGGGINRKNCHPLEMDQEDSDIEYVIHNGSVVRYKSMRRSHIRKNHTYSTTVDSEVIGHTILNVPTKMEEVDTRAGYRLNGMLNYLVFSKDAILIHNDRSKYYLSDDFTMTCRSSPDWGGENSTEWMVITPGGNVETKEVDPGKNMNTMTRWQDRREGNEERSGEDLVDGETISVMYEYQDKLAITYEDQFPESDYISVYLVAPGVALVIHKDKSKSEYIYEWEKETFFNYLIGRSYNHDNDNNDPPGGEQIEIAA